MRYVQDETESSMREYGGLHAEASGSRDNGDGRRRREGLAVPAGRRGNGDGRRREGLDVPAGPRFRPCLWRFFAKGTVGYADCARFSTVPFPIFCKRHGRLCRPCRDFDRAFDDFLQKARSVAPPVHAFRPCLLRFFTKGTVVHTGYARDRAL